MMRSPQLSLRLRYGAVLVVWGVSSLVGFDFCTQRVSDSHDNGSAMKQYVLHRLMSLIGTFARQKLDSVCVSRESVLEAQEAFLRKLLNDHKDTEYGKFHEFSSMQTLQDFQSKHPLTRYDHVRYESHPQHDICFTPQLL